MKLFKQILPIRTYKAIYDALRRPIGNL